jgi:integrase/recombinase XerD
MDGTTTKTVTPLGATVILTDQRGRPQAAGLLLSWGGGRSLQTVLCTVREALLSPAPLLISRCGAKGSARSLRSLADLSIGDPYSIGEALAVLHVDKHELAAVGWAMRDCADAASGSLGSIAEGTPVFTPAVVEAARPEALTAVLLEGHVAGRELPAAGEAGGRMLVSVAKGSLLGGTPVFTRRRAGTGALQLIGFVDGAAVSGLGLVGVVPVAALLDSAAQWKRAAVTAMPNLHWAGQSPGEYQIHPRIAEFLAENATSGRFSKATITARRQDLLNLDRWARGRGLDVTTMADADLALYFDERVDQGRRATTIIRERGSIERFYEYLVGRGERSSGPARPTLEDEEHYRAKTVLTVREVQRVLDFDGAPAATALRDRALVELMYGTGLRTKELATLTIAQLDLRKGVVRVPTRREGARELPLNEPVRSALRDYLRTLGPAASQPPDAPVFRNPRGLPFTRQTIAKILAQRAVAAGIKKDVTGMTLRHSAASHLLARGLDRKGVAQFLGLGSASEVQQYLPRRARSPERRVN